MSRRLELLIGPDHAGTVFLERGKLQFHYHPGYTDRPNATPLSVSMPLAIRTHRDSAIAPWLWGLLPDPAPKRWSPYCAE